jgi:hypothetical protein
MKGWKTWIAALCMGALGIMSILDGNTETGLQQIVGALALVGLGHKLDKSSLEPALKSSQSGQSGTELNSVPRDNSDK